MKFIRFKEQESELYRIYEQNIHIGTVEIIVEQEGIYIENVFIDEKYRNRGYLRKVIAFLSTFRKPMTCLPLPEHVEKFKHLGFRLYKIEMDDAYYRK